MGENGKHATREQKTIQPEDIDEAVTDAMGLTPDADSQASTALAIKEQFGELDSPQELSEASELYRYFIDKRGHDSDLVLVTAVNNAVIHFHDAEQTGVIVVKELVEAGDLDAGAQIDELDLDIVGHYLLIAERHGIADIEIAKVATAFNIPSSYRGLELFQKLTAALEGYKLDDPDLIDALRELGTIDTDTYDEYKRHEEAASTGSLNRPMWDVSGLMDELEAGADRFASDEDGEYAEADNQEHAKKQQSDVDGAPDAEILI